MKTLKQFNEAISKITNSKKLKKFLDDYGFINPDEKLFETENFWKRQLSLEGEIKIFCFYCSKKNVIEFRMYMPKIELYDYKFRVEDDWRDKLSDFLDEAYKVITSL